MILVDVNVLVYAFDSDAPQHEAYAPWLAEALGGAVPTVAEEFALLDTVLSGFVRIVTHPKIMPSPAPIRRALEFVNALIGAPSARWLPASESLWRAFAQLIDVDRAVKGNLVPDAYIAAAAIAHGARLATADRGFARFSGLTWFDPADGQR
ncbi:TA system VapC family ribonuclease toxin [Arthrobacter sp. A5]|uniref:TA system VapC family ribonuclease toxin n=1 Tax=Arthrobacter sp. A5 TaxID=576926 RepID=UPI003DA97496